MASVTKQPKRKRSRRRGSVTSDSAGWITRSVPFANLNRREPLAVHGGWFGPHKLVQTGRGCARVSEVFVDRHAERGASCTGEEPYGCEQLVERLVQGPLAAREELPLDNWQPPKAEDLSNHLRVIGYEPAVDEQEKLRLTLKNRGCDGDVRVRRATGQLRLTMRIGQWSNLDAMREQAMLQLARRHNDRVRLVRIAWDVEGSARRCDAQVDLSGLPCDPEYTWFWSSVLRMAIGGLELTLHQMGKELDVLAAPQHERIATWLIDQNSAPTKKIIRPGKPR